mmetsp:Transcript_36593/g.92423  ORF Transcript_36593/g.92423 Transcript_36593/m.92423 type:complete len:202 (-) Transcript_36593:77-682(-)
MPPPSPPKPGTWLSCTRCVAAHSTENVDVQQPSSTPPGAWLRCSPAIAATMTEQAGARGLRDHLRLLAAGATRVAGHHATDAELGDQAVIGIPVLPVQVLQQALPLAENGNQTALGCMVLAVGGQMLANLLDASSGQGNLVLGRASVLLVPGLLGQVAQVNVLLVLVGGADDHGTRSAHGRAHSTAEGCRPERLHGSGHFS